MARGHTYICPGERETDSEKSPNKRPEMRSPLPPKGTNFADSSFAYHILYLVVGILYPAYASLGAIETPTKADDTVWLIYWIVFAVFSILEFFADYVFSWFPFYTSLKVAFLLWCTSPIPYNGAYYVFKIFIQPFFAFYGKNLDPYFVDIIDMAQKMFPPYPVDDNILHVRKCIFQLAHSTSI